MKQIILCSAAALLLIVSNANAQLPKRPEAQQPKANNVPQHLYKCTARNTAHGFFPSGFHKTKGGAQAEALLLCKKGSSPADHCNIINCS